jgi:hypothetical protein
MQVQTAFEIDIPSWFWWRGATNKRHCGLDFNAVSHAPFSALEAKELKYVTIQSVPALLASRFSVPTSNERMGVIIPVLRMVVVVVNAGHGQPPRHAAENCGTNVWWQKLGGYYRAGSGSNANAVLE